MMKRAASVLVVLALAGCGAPESSDPRGAVPAPSVTLTAAERAAWAPGPPHRGTVPVLVYDRLPADAFARQMTLLDHAGYQTISLSDFVRFVRRKPVELPPRPLLLTFADARLDSWAASDAVLRRLGFNAVLFAAIGPIEKRRPEVLTWEELDAAARSGRWDVQFGSGTGDRLIQYGPGSDDVGPFYAYRGAEEVLGGWRERVFSDLSYGEQQLAHHVHGYRPFAFAPPYGNYGQLGTNDRRIPRELIERALLSFDVVFTQDRSGFAVPGARNPLGRFQVTADVSEAELRAMLG
jgi:hypothetical protein